MPAQLERCERHALLFDPDSAAGCVLCRREHNLAGRDRRKRSLFIVAGLAVIVGTVVVGIAVSKPEPRTVATSFAYSVELAQAIPDGSRATIPSNPTSTGARVPPVFALDSSVPRADAGGSAGGPVAKPRPTSYDVSRSPVLAMGACIRRIDECEMRTKQSTDECVRGAVVCVDPIPQLDDPAGLGCCPRGCVDRYFEMRTAGRSGAAAMQALVRAKCYPGAP